METKELIPKIEEAAPGAVLEMRPFGRSGEVSLWVEMKSIAKVAKFLRDDPAFSFDWLENLSVVEIDGALVLTYFLRSIMTGYALILRGSVLPKTSREEIEVPSVSKVWLMAKPIENEISELFGVRFVGNPVSSPRFELNGVDGFPLRKAFELVGAPFRHEVDA